MLVETFEKLAKILPKQNTYQSGKSCEVALHQLVLKVETPIHNKKTCEAVTVELPSTILLSHQWYQSPGR